jgi:class 3 adenylate cyclase
MRGTRWTFTASGAVTNLAARLAGVAGPGQIVVGAETARRLDGYQVERLPAERLKNTQQDIEIYRVAPAR